MTNEEMLQKIQAYADEKSQTMPFKRKAQLELIYTEAATDGATECYCLGNDMPLLVFRIFTIDKDGNVSENSLVENAVNKTRHYNVDVKPGLKLVPPAIMETNDYDIVLESELENHAVELKIKSSNGRDITMMEVYRYFDYVSKVFFVSCVSLSFPGQYLFGVIGEDSKKLRMIVGGDDKLKERINMITELLQAKVLPSYKTIAAGAQLLSNKNAVANVTLTDDKGQKTEFKVQFCYDDPETMTRFVFLGKASNPKEGIILSQDTMTQKLSTPASWDENQKAAVTRIQELMKSDNNKFREHVVSFFADDLDFRYAAFKAGKLTFTPTAPTAEAK